MVVREAQTTERTVRIRKVKGSNPSVSTKTKILTFSNRVRIFLISEVVCYSTSEGGDSVVSR